MTKTIHKLRNNRTPGYDQISPKLLKYVPTEFHDLIAESTNNIFTKHEHVNVNYEMLTLLREPGKPKGPTKCRRPVIESHLK